MYNFYPSLSASNNNNNNNNSSSSSPQRTSTIRKQTSAEAAIANAKSTTANLSPDSRLPRKKIEQTNTSLDFIQQQHQREYFHQDHDDLSSNVHPNMNNNNSIRIESRHLALPRPLDDAGVVTQLPRLQQQFPMIHEALIRSDDIIGHGEQLLFSKQEEIDKCVVVSNQLVQELEGLTKQHRDLTERCEVVSKENEDLIQQVLSQMNNNKKVLEIKENKKNKKKSKKSKKHHHSNKHHRKYSSDDSSSADSDDSSDSDDSDSSSDSSEEDRRRKNSKKHNSSSKKGNNKRLITTSRKSENAVEVKMEQLNQLQEAVADLLRTMDRFHSNPHLFASSQQQQQDGNNNNNYDDDEPIIPASSERIFRTMWNSASATLRDHLVAIDPRWRHHIFMLSSAAGDQQQQQLSPQQSSPKNRNNNNNQHHIKALMQRLQQNNNSNNNNPNNNNNNPHAVHLQNIDLENYLHRNANNNNNNHQSSVSPSNNSHNNNSPSPSSKDALLRAAMFELEQSDRIVSQLVMRCSLLEEELELKRQEAEQLRDSNRRLSSEYTESVSADAQKYAALDECRVSLEKRLRAVEADREKLLVHQQHMQQMRRSVSSSSSQPPQQKQIQQQQQYSNTPQSPQQQQYQFTNNNNNNQQGGMNSTLRPSQSSGSSGRFG